MQILSGLLATTIVIDLLIAGIVTWRCSPHYASLFFSIYLVGNALWATGLFYLLHHPSAEAYLPSSLIYFISQLTYLTPIILMTGKLWFLKSYLNKGKLITSAFDYVALFLTASVTILVFIPNTFFIDVFAHPEGYISLSKGPLVFYFSIFVFFYYLYPFWIVRNRLRQIKNKLLRKQFKLFIWSHGLITGASMITNWILPRYLEIPQLTGTGPIFSMAVATVFAYSITHYHFFDLRINFHRILTYTASTSVLIALVWYIATSAELTRINILLIDVATVLTALIAFLPIKNFFHRLFNLLIFGESQNWRERLHKLIAQIAHTNLAIEKAVTQILSVLQHTLGLRSCRFVPTSYFIDLGVIDAYTSLFKDGGALYAEELACREELENDPHAGAIASLMRDNKVAVLTPITENDRLIGAIAVEQKTDGKPFTSEEIAELEWTAEHTKLYFANLETVPASIISEREDFRDLEHHINTPLARISLRTEALSKKRSASQAELKKISSDAFQASRAFNNFIEIENLPKYGEFIRQPAELENVITNTLLKLSGELGKRGYTAKPKVIMRGKQNFVVVGNQVVLEGTILELLINAVLFSKKPVTLETKDNGNVVTVQITSVGSLNADQINTALTKFGHFGNNAGNGLGLYLSKKVIELVGGNLTLTSTAKKVTAEITLRKVTGPE